LNTAIAWDEIGFIVVCAFVRAEVDWLIRKQAEIDKWLSKQYGWRYGQTKGGDLNGEGK
jgi:hypothetical protein